MKLRAAQVVATAPRVAEVVGGLSIKQVSLSGLAVLKAAGQKKIKARIEKREGIKPCTQTQ